jgi:hypothetical protein
MAAAVTELDFCETRRACRFRGCRSDSIDYAVMEKTDKAMVVPLDAGWSVWARGRRYGMLPTRTATATSAPAM